MATALSTGLFSRLRSFPQVLPDGKNITTLDNTANQTEVFSYSRMAANGLLVRARDVQFKAPSASGLSYLLTADGFISPTVDALAASNMRAQIDAGGEVWNTAAYNTLTLNVQNQTGSTISDQWTNWSIEVDRPSVATKLQFPEAFVVSPEEEELARTFGVGPRDVLPRPLSWIIANEYAGHIVDTIPFSATKDVADTGTTSFFGVNVQGGTMLVLRSLYISAGSGSDGLTAQLTVDEQSDFLSLPAYSVGNGNPVATFIQAEKSISLQCTATSASNSVSVAGVVWVVRLTDLIRARLNLGVQNAIERDAKGNILKTSVRNKLLAGVL